MSQFEVQGGPPDRSTAIGHVDGGAVLLEYGLLITSIAIVVMAAVIILGGSVLDLFESVLGWF